MSDKNPNVKCKYCDNPATEKHHRFSQSKSNLRKYGRKLIDDDRNMERVCSACNSSHAVVKSINEREFCRELDILKCIYCACYLKGDGFGGNEGCIVIDNQFPEAELCRFFIFFLENYSASPKLDSASPQLN